MSKGKGGMSAKAAAEALEGGENALVPASEGDGEGIVLPSSRAKPAGNHAEMLARVLKGRKAKAVTLPVLVLKTIGESRYIGFNTAMSKSTLVIPGKEDQKPATIAQVVDLESGEVYQFLVPTVVQKNLEREYPDHKYVGKAFLMTNIGLRQKGSNKYHEFRIDEVPQKDDSAQSEAAGE